MSARSRGIVPLFGGLLTLISLFLAWFSRYDNVWHCTYAVNGLGQFSAAGCLGISTGLGNLPTAGNIMLVGSIIVLLFSLLILVGAFPGTSSKGGAAITMIGGVVGLVGFISYATGAQNVQGYSFSNLFTSFTPQFGIGLAIIGILISLIGSIAAMSSTGQQPKTP